jgi:hypothetical protein
MSFDNNLFLMFTDNNGYLIVIPFYYYCNNEFLHCPKKVIEFEPNIIEIF